MCIFVYHECSDLDSETCVTTLRCVYVCVSVNLGGLLLQALLEFWPRTHTNPVEEEESEHNHGRL